jgi:hypothetical protein
MTGFAEDFHFDVMAEASKKVKRCVVVSSLGAYG